MSTTDINEWLKVVAQAGDINLLYTLIQEDPHVLEHIDSIPFVETPLHIAASFGQLEFATEVMRLKPSFAWKLNQQGFSPIHLAMQHDQKRMVLRFVDINKDLVRVKGRDGFTPLHLASQAGDVDLLADLLSTSPNSIRDVTVRSETALHVAMKNGQYEALQVLVGWLEKTPQSNASYLRWTILNWEDEEGNTILHISALNNDRQALQLLLKTRMDLNAKNLEKSTALDIAASAEIKGILCASKRAKHGSSVTDAPTLADMLRSKITFAGRFVVAHFRLRNEISEEQRNNLIAVAIVLVSISFQAIQSPPAGGGGGVYQANAGDINNNNNNTTNVNTTSTSLISKATAALDIVSDYVLGNPVGFDHLDIRIILLALSTAILTMVAPGGEMGKLMTFAALMLYISFGTASNVPSLNSVFGRIKFLLLPCYMMGVFHIYFRILYGRLLKYSAVNLGARTRDRGGKNIW